MRLLASVLVLACAGCGGHGQGNKGELGGHCYPNGTCNVTLFCGGGICLALPDARLLDAQVDESPDAQGTASDSRIDASPDGPTTPQCSVLTQTGCMTGEKCSWFHDTELPTPLGHVGCAPNGTAAVDAGCAFGADGPQGYDNCVKGSVCVNGRCAQICDGNGGNPTCGTNTTCGLYADLFDRGGTNVAGVCDPTCDPLADNDFDGSGPSIKTGSVCTAGQGCYGLPSASSPTRWTCLGEFNNSLGNGSSCTTAAGCAPDSTHVYLNGCAQGYVPLIVESFGSSQFECVAICKPGNTYLGNPGTEYPRGQSPHHCSNAEGVGVFDESSNGDQCMYSWRFEIDATGHFERSPTSDIVGFCINHQNYRWDSNNDGVIDSQDAPLPSCASLPLSAPSPGAPTAADMGCVDTLTAGNLPTYQFGQPRPQTSSREK